MKINYSLYFIVIFIFSVFNLQCTQQKSADNIFILKKDIATIVDSFTLIYHNRNIHELYINKLTPDNAIILLYAGDKSLVEKENNIYKESSIIQILSNNIPIDIYSGIERYMTKSDSTSTKLGLNDETNRKMNDDIIWVINDSCGILRIDKNYFSVYPFMPLPIQVDMNKFSPPVIKEPDESDNN